MMDKVLRLSAVCPLMLEGMPRHGHEPWTIKRDKLLRIPRLRLTCSVSGNGSHDKVIWVQTDSKVSKHMLLMTSPSIARRLFRSTHSADLRNLNDTFRSKHCRRSSQLRLRPACQLLCLTPEVLAWLSSGAR